METNEIKNEISEITKWYEKTKRKEFNNKSRARTKEGKYKNRDTYETV